MLLRWLKIFLLLWTVSVCFIAQKLNARLESLVGIPGEEETLAVFKVRPVGREHFFNGTLSVLTDLDNSCEAVINTNSLKNGVWTPTHINLRRSPCDSYSNYFYKYYFPPNADTNLVPGGDNCLAKGEYYFRKIPISTENWPTIPYSGTVQVVAKFYCKAKFIGGFEAVCTVTEKPT